MPADEAEAYLCSMAETDSNRILARSTTEPVEAVSEAVLVQQ